MNHRFLVLVGGLVVPAAVTWLSTMPVAGQARSAGARTSGSPAKTYTAPRTIDGQPDLQGIWTNATYTLLERPKNVTKEFYTREEALDLARRAAAESRRACSGAKEQGWPTRCGTERAARCALYPDGPQRAANACRGLQQHLS